LHSVAYVCFMFCSYSAVYGFWPVEDSCDTGLLGVMQWQKVNVCLELQCDKVKCT